jgi:hypothetical protein
MLANLKIIWQFHAQSVHQKVSRFFVPVRLNETRFGPKKSRPRYISAQKISTLFDAPIEHEIAR